jgi:hypothetical protein
MKDVTSVFDHYRVSARAIWNTAFWPDPDSRNWESIERFDEIKKILFGELVLRKLSRDWPISDLFGTAISFFQIVPSYDAPIMIQNPRAEAASGYWDHPVNRIKPEDAEMIFLGYFDWNLQDYLDLRYYHVKITKFPAHSELVGREALMERNDAHVYMADE